jgi:hypothetical protein
MKLLKFIMEFGMCRLCNSDDAPSADPAIGQAAGQAAAIGQQGFDFYKNLYDTTIKPQTDALWDLTNEYSAKQMENSEKNQGRADDLWNTYVTNYKPVLEKSAQESLEYGNEADQNRAAGRAVTDVRQQGQINREAMDRNLASMGINPNSGKFVTAYGANALRETAASAGAGTNAREMARDKGIMLRQGAAATGSNIASTGLGYSSLGTSQGTNAINSVTSANNATINGASVMGTGYNMARQGILDKSNILNTKFSNEMTGYNAQQQANAGLSSGIGTIAGMGLGAAINKFF